MRYYSFALGTGAEQIEKQTKVNLREYAYQCPIGALNNYMYRNMKNSFSFLAYREETEKLTLAVFSYDEKKNSFDDAYSYILKMLNDAFDIKRIKVEPYEITMYHFLDCYLEATRRGYFHVSQRFVESANLWLHDYYCYNAEKSLHYEFQEKIISENQKKKKAIYDESLLKEIANIESCENDSEISGNIVHYVVSSRSIEATEDMIETLMQSLYRANRISSKRMEIITEIEPDVFRGNNHLEEMIENNYGGLIIFDLTEKFGYDSTDYTIACKYIEKLVKKYRKECLFVFTYNMDHPGFSYYLLPQLKKYVIPVMLREGSGDRKSAIRYLKELIKNSEYTKYANQVNEFMQLYSESKFTQTDVLAIFEKFETWCLNKNVLQAYDYAIADDFMLDRDEDAESSYEKLHKMIGLGIVKEQIEDIIATDIVEKERKKRLGNSYQSSTMHMIFGGNPGSAKTTVAKLFAGIAKEKGILKSGAFVERGGMDLDGLLCVHAIREAFKAAKGGVLFIDEAYSITSDTAVTVLLQEMENHREDVIVILAGYNERMQAFMALNEGLKSRVPYWVEFPDYNAEELTQIFKLMLKERGLNATDKAVKEARYIFEKVMHTDNFGNGRYVRNLIEHALQKQSVRLLGTNENVDNISKKDLFLITKEDVNSLDEGLKEERENGTAKRELEEMVGLTGAKAIINKAISSFKLKKLCIDKGIHKDKASMHMVFTGNPGTAKTTIARLFAEILKDEKVLATGNFVEVGRAELVGEHVGKTAPKVKKKFKEAQGGVLFIDEAYSLCDSYENGFGDEAINTLVQEMENHREDVIVIFAGYPDKMKDFLDRNPGMLSRIAFQVEFEDYSTEELCEITRLMLSKKQMKITDAAMDKLRCNYENARSGSDYGNGRYVRKMLEEAEMNLAERVSQIRETELTTELLTTIEESDIPEKKRDESPGKKKIGFCA